MTTTDSDDPIEEMEIFVTAEEAFPAFEREFLNAKSEIVCSFRVFDLATGLRSSEAKAIGDTWFELFEHVLNRGVDITLILSDFDPIIAENYHRKSWQSAEQLAGVREISGRGRLTFRVAAHPARAGILPRLIFKSKVRSKLEETSPDQHTPGLRDVSRDEVFDLRPVTHHQKLAVFDRRRLYIGGLDLDERRYDTRRHDQDSDQTWADVQVLVTGPVVEAARRHILTFENVVAGRRKPETKSPGFLRTLSSRRGFAPIHISPRTLCNEIEKMHLKAIARSSEFIYIESQYLRHLTIAKALASAAKKHPELRLLVVLPAAPEDVAFEASEGDDARLGEGLQADCIDLIQDAFGQRALFASPVQPWRANGAPKGRDRLAGAPIVYVHSKVSLFDGREAIVSSANLNGRSLRWDTEAGVHIERAEHVANLWGRLFDHWFVDRAPARDTDLADKFEIARVVVEANAHTPPERRTAFLVPYDSEAARAFGKHIAVVPNELV